MNVHESTILDLSKPWAGSPNNGSVDLLWKGVIIFDLVEKAPQKKNNYSHEGSPNAGFSVGKFSTKPGEEGVASDLMNQEWWVYGNASGEGNYVVFFLGNTMFGQNLLVCSHYCQTNKKCVDDLPYKNGGLTWFNRQPNGFVVDIIADLSLLSWFTTRLGFTAHICILNVGYNRTYKWRAPHCTTDQFRQLHQHVWWISWKVQVFTLFAEFPIFYQLHQ